MGSYGLWIRIPTHALCSAMVCGQLLAHPCTGFTFCALRLMESQHLDGRCDRERWIGQNEHYQPESCRHSHCQPFTLWRAAQAWAVLFRNPQVRSAELIFIFCANETIQGCFVRLSAFTKQDPRKLYPCLKYFRDHSFKWESCFDKKAQESVQSLAIISGFIVLMDHPFSSSLFWH